MFGYGSYLSIYMGSTNKQIGARAAGACTCERASEENRVPSGDLCSCGARPAGMFKLILASSCSLAWAVGKYSNEIRCLHL